MLPRIPREREVLVTGLGPISAIGCGRLAFWESLKSGRHGFGPITLCEARDLPSKIAAEVRGFRLADFLPDGKLLARLHPRPVQFALAAGTLALEDAGWSQSDCDPDRVGVYVGTSAGMLGTAFNLKDQWARTGTLSSRAGFAVHHHAIACTLSSYLDLRGPCQTISTGCNSGIDAMGHAFRLIQAGAADAVLVVGSDSEVVWEIIMALCAADTLATRYNDRPPISSRPFDSDRDGNVIAEGAGAVLLESRSHAERRGARPYARLAGYAVCAAGRNREYDARTPQVEVRPAARTLQLAVQEAELEPLQVDLVNANGSSSVRYDPIEAMALQVVFGEWIEAVPVHSIKSMLGQGGAQASAFQAIAACLSIRHGLVPPTINHDVLAPECAPLHVVTQLRAQSIQNVLVHTIGFGGFFYSGAVFTA